MQDATATAGDPGSALLALYDEALPRVYGYLLRRCGRAGLAEDLCAQTFLAAVGSVRRHDPEPLSVAWLIGVARHKLIDHWRAQSREERGLSVIGEGPGPEGDDPWDAQLDAMRAQDTLAKLIPPHRAALTLRYLDDLTVPTAGHRHHRHRLRRRRPLPGRGRRPSGAGLVRRRPRRPSPG